ncbi:hypothetical protein GPEL0_01r2399 [Geoanaerobacter pelophilus]|uniref:Uncharacterized protein n=1 Tax=Geoanaerobacter pelophilus TaxID=60036 RepID=A0ABQ0MIE7_9BACT|nr:hypothetical protein [Geoanaerobacter pelophilus]GAW66857.1 hypothetical protein GPEL0_01r2399 [Geoanaerobacter pelophilus]
MFDATTNAITFPNTDNATMIRDAVLKALADEDFMGNLKKVKAAAEVLTPKDTLTATLKRLQGNANRDFLEKKDKKVIGFIDENRADKIKIYVQERFQSYMDDPKTSDKATKLFGDAYPAKVKEATIEEDAVEDVAIDQDRTEG